MVKVGDKVEVIWEDRETPFPVGTICKVVELLDEGCIWAKDKDGSWGCLIPDEYVKVKKGAK